MSFDFPNSPTEGQVFTPAGGPAYQFTGGVWKIQGGGSGAPLDSPVFTGDPRAPTPAPGDDDTSIATSAFVKAAIAAAIAAIPAPPTIPVGHVDIFAMSTPPTGYLVCNGAAVSRTTYAALFAAIGNTYGSGDGATTFNLPDLRGRFIRGWDSGAGLDPGRVFGSLQDDALESHTHTGSSDTAAAHTHTATSDATAASAGTPAGTLSSTSAGTPAGTLSSDSHTHTGTTASAGAHTHGLPEGMKGTNNTAYGPTPDFPGSAVAETDSAGAHTHTFTTSSDSHTHIFTGSAMGTHGHTFTGSAMAAHDHAVTTTVAAGGAHSHALTINAAGGSETRPANVAMLACIKYQ